MEIIPIYIFVFMSVVLVSFFIITPLVFIIYTYFSISKFEEKAKKMIEGENERYFVNIKCSNPNLHLNGSNIPGKHGEVYWLELLSHDRRLDSPILSSATIEHYGLKKLKRICYELNKLRNKV